MESRNLQNFLALIFGMCNFASMPAKIPDSNYKKLIPQNFRLPLDVSVWLRAEKERTGVPMERLVLSALLSMYPIRKR